MTIHTLHGNITRSKQMVISMIELTVDTCNPLVFQELRNEQFPAVHCSYLFPIE